MLKEQVDIRKSLYKYKKNSKNYVKFAKKINMWYNNKRFAKNNKKESDIYFKNRKNIA